MDHETDRTKQGLGRYGEALAARDLTAAGMVLLARNWRSPSGEIDLLLREGDVLVVCEVKTRSGAAFGGGYEAVTRAKRRKVRNLADAFLQGNAFERARVRFDVASVWVGPRGADVEIFEDAF